MTTMWRTSLLRFLVAPLAGILICACTDRPPVPPTGDVPQLTLTALPLIGTQVGGGPEEFGEIADIEIGADGSVFVLDGLKAVVQVFDRDGTHLRTIGRRGSGPGELEGPTGLTWGPDGRLWVVDGSRYTVFNPDGSFVDSYPGRRVFFDPPPWPGGLSPDGLLHELDHDIGTGRTTLIEYEIVDGEAVELRRAGAPPQEMPTIEFRGGNGVMGVLGIPLAPFPFWRVGPGGHLWYAQTGEPWVYRRPTFGGPVTTFGRDFDPPPWTAVERQAELEMGFYDRFRPYRAEWERYTSLIPERKPHVRGIFFDDEDNVWIIRSDFEEPGSDANLIDVYDPEGNLIAVTAAAFEELPFPRVRAGLMAAVVKNELEVDFVALWEIR